MGWVSSVTQNSKKHHQGEKENLQEAQCFSTLKRENINAQLFPQWNPDLSCSGLDSMCEAILGSSNIIHMWGSYPLWLAPPCGPGLPLASRSADF